MTEENSLREHSRRAEDPPAWSTNEVFELCSSRETRITLAHLSDREATTIDELATVIAGQTAAEEGRIEGKELHGHARVALHHSVLPRLADHDILEYDPETGEVRNVDVPDAITTVLRISE
jgi:hypothetical protein